MKGVERNVTVTEFLEGDVKQLGAKGFAKPFSSMFRIDDDTTEDAFSLFFADQFSICNKFSLRGQSGERM